MKKLMYFAAALLVLVGCNKNDNIVENAPEGTPFEKGQKVTLTIGTGAQQGPNRVAGVDNTADNKIDFTWEEGDKILVKVGEATAEFTLISGEGTADGEFAGVMPADGSTFDIQFPVNAPDLSAQVYSEDKAIPADKMAFAAEGCTLDNPATLLAQNAMLQLNLYGTYKTVGKIVFTNKTAEPDESYTLTCGGVAIGATSATATPFYMVVPAGNYQFEVAVYDNATTPAKICSFATSAAKTFVAGECMNMPAKEVAQEISWTYPLSLGQSTATTIIIETGKDVSSYTEDDTYKKLDDDGLLWEYLDGTTLKIQTPASKINSGLAYMFGYYENVESISGLQYIHATTTSCMFEDCNSLTSLDLSGFNTEDVTNMSYMFSGCEALESLNLSSFNTAKVTDMSNMFVGCTNLSSLNISSINTEKVTNMSNMFRDCKNLQSLDLSGFNTEDVTDMSSMFVGCTNLSSLNLSGFNTANVTDMNGMFCDCTNLSSLNLSGFNTANVTDMSNMFCFCGSLNSLTLSNDFKVASWPYMMFFDCGNDCTVYGVTDSDIKEALKTDTNWNEDNMHFDGE